MKGRNGILLFVPQDKGLLEDRKWRLKICRITNESLRNGNRKWKTKNLQELPIQTIPTD
jgi:hypothetical protein